MTLRAKHGVVTQRAAKDGVFVNWRWLTTFLVIFCSLLFSFRLYAAIPKHWESASYAYESQDSTLADVLSDFAMAYGLKIAFDGEFSQAANGKFRATSAKAFLARLALEHQFQWFVFDGTLYISANDAQKVERIKVKQLTSGSLKKALTSVGLIDERFGWGEIPSEKVILVSGPKRYVEFVRQLAKGEKSVKENNPMLTFQLRHASVADRTIRYRDRTITIPGVATVLSDVLSRRKTRFSADKETQSAGEQQDSPQTKAAGTQAISQFRTLLNGGSGANQLVTADIRTNQIIIHDDAEQKERYQAIIDTLDVPLKLLEIGAVIVDVNRNQLDDLGINWLFANTTEPIESTSALVVKRLGDFMMRLYALQDKGQVAITASPSVMTQENYPAVIDLNQSVYQTATGERVAQFQKVTAGTSLQVIPRLIQPLEYEPEGTPAIQLVVDIEDGKLLPDRNDDLLIQTSNISTQAVISAGHALVLGGFTIHNYSQRDSQVPYLGDAPWIGELFKRSREGITQTQRLFILIPKVIRPDEPSALPRPRKRLIAEPVANEAITDAFQDLADGLIPAGFKAASTPNVLPCSKLTTHVAWQGAQWLQGKSMKLGIGVVQAGENALDLPVIECEGDGVLAVSFWPPLPLLPHQKGEIFVAMKP